MTACLSPLYWHNCYSGAYDLWCPDAMSHPAKMSPALAFRIMEHLQELGLLAEGEPILDPMAGISTTGLVAGALGHPFIGVELEDKFVKLSLANKEYAERRLHKTLDWQVIQGDSRRLSEVLKEKGLVSLTSPPYLDARNPDHNAELEERRLEIAKERGVSPDKVSHLDYTKGLKSITSPPY